MKQLYSNNHRAIIHFHYPDQLTKAELLKIATFPKARSHNITETNLEKFLNNQTDYENDYYLYMTILLNDASEFQRDFIPKHLLLKDKGTDIRPLPSGGDYKLTYLRPYSL